MSGRSRLALADPGNIGWPRSAPGIAPFTWDAGSLNGTPNVSAPNVAVARALHPSSPGLAGFLHAQSPMKLVRIILLCVALALPVTLLADEPKTKSPLDYSVGQYGFILGIALLGGLVSWWGKVRKGEIQVWSVNSLIGELATSALAGLLCFWICEWAGLAPLLTAALTGIFGHMGTRALTLLEEWGQARFPGSFKKDSQ